MIGLDCNILVQLAFADHPANTKTLALIQTEAAKGTKLVFPSLVINEFLHVVTDARRFTPPLTMTEALDWIDDFIANPIIELLEPTRASTDQTLRWFAAIQFGAQAYSRYTPRRDPPYRRRPTIAYCQSRGLRHFWRVRNNLAVTPKQA
jgi:predicted nucleic acid-binding protein